MSFMRSDEFLAMIVPIVIYWVYSGFYEILGNLDKYRLHSRRDEETKNLVSKREVVKGVLLQQAIQATIALILFKETPKLKLHSYWRSSCSQRVRIVLNLKGLGYSILLKWILEVLLNLCLYFEGLGYEYKAVNLLKGEQFTPAYRYAKRGAYLVLAARREAELKAVAKAAKNNGAPDVLVIPVIPCSFTVYA
ncbi:uncharacterized protein A4U43_C01F3240 [Asparagus officinalis]|uniref:GST N-terminal domain-containing protein n=1 Tax=Asparagus officinalis TaxID=4686 RepID=A0A5P1FR31_ASPOF|nr:uncharacterized protein A4U43_C01F3240 [Asparagus officinalis]